MVCELATPTVTFPKFAVDGVMLNAACTPVPLTETTVLPPCEFVTVTFPETVSADLGLNVTLIVWL